VVWPHQPAGVVEVRPQGDWVAQITGALALEVRDAEAEARLVGHGLQARPMVEPQPEAVVRALDGPREEGEASGPTPGAEAADHQPPLEGEAAGVHPSQPSLEADRTEAEGVAVDPRFRLEELGAALLVALALEDPPEEEAEGAVEEACLAQVATLTSRADGAAALKEANDGARGKPTGRCAGLRPVCGITCRCICQEKRAELGSTTCG